MIRKLMKYWCIINTIYIFIASNIKWLSHEYTSLYFQFFQTICFIIPITYFIDEKRKKNAGVPKFICSTFIFFLWCVPTVAFIVELLTNQGTVL